MLGEGEAEDSSIFLRIMLLALPLPLSLPQWRGISLLAVDPATEAVEASGKKRRKKQNVAAVVVEMHYGDLWGAVLWSLGGMVSFFQQNLCHVMQLN
jgi:hypothetical protein